MVLWLQIDIGFLGLRHASFFFSRLADLYKGATSFHYNSLLVISKSTNFCADNSILGVDAVHHLQSIIGACQNFSSDFAKDCIEAIHLLENRRSNMRRLLYAKLAFCLEKNLSFADLVCKMELCPDKKSFKNVATFVGCTRSVQIVIMDANVQVREYIVSMHCNQY